MKISTLILAVILGTYTAVGAPKGTVAERPRYGTNYTVPFAHAYRALGRLGIDRHKAIDRDTYHFARLGLDAFRLHLWDVELSDADGNLLDNEHLELLDYLISALKKRGIDIILTAQTNFGNGYPERNSDPNGAFSYDYPKCGIHDNASAQAIQANYLNQLVNHVNRYTGKRIADDPDIIAIEINNEPCHSGTEDEITAYVDSMADAIRRQGWEKDILYNVSHNLWRTPAFFRAAIDGTTYQWYPTGLVKNSRRRGNFLPVLDDYHIPFDTIASYDRLSRVIYEYDPADVLDSYLYPAAARTFRKAGFDWITQFAYDPIDMAAYNTEYQTHYLNLAYTPGKAIGMMIAAEVTRRTPRGKSYGTYPRDTIFGEKNEFLVSARRDLAMLNDGDCYFHTNNTADQPCDRRKLRRIAGVGSSPLISTDGTGAYFLDRLPDGIWRLELMPDVYLTADPFSTPSLSRRVGEIVSGPVNLTITLPGLSKNFTYRCLESDTVQHSEGGAVTLTPGVWFLGEPQALARINTAGTYAGGRLGISEYVAPENASPHFTVLHTPAPRITRGLDIEITATVVADVMPDSLTVYPQDVNFWNDHNRLYKLRRTGKNRYSATIPASEAGKKDCFRYNIVAFGGGGGSGATTWPSGRGGTPLDWDFNQVHNIMYNIAIADPEGGANLLDFSEGTDEVELSTVPEAWQGVTLRHRHDAPQAENRLALHKDTDVPTRHLLLSRRVSDRVEGCRFTPDSRLVLRLGRVSGVDTVYVNIVSIDGLSYSVPVTVKDGCTAEVTLGSLRLSDTWLTPAPYPSFLERRFSPGSDAAQQPDLSQIESLVLDFPASAAEMDVEILGAYILN